MSISIIAAVSENRVIGRSGGLPWRLPADLRRFRVLTTGHTVIMGRRTFESIGGRLPDRVCLVLSRRAAASCDEPGVLVVPDLETALARAGDDPEVFVAGGSEVYAEALARADRIYLTVVHAEVEGDAFFPEIDWSEWDLVEDRRFEADERHEHAFSFRRYERARA